MAKNVLVTGGCGFIGANFIHYVLSIHPAWQIFNLDKLTYAGNPENLKEAESNPNYNFIHGDICDETLLENVFEEHKIDTVVHFAAESHVDRSITGPGEFIHTNINGTFSLLETARRNWFSNSDQIQGNRRFIHVSTDEVYGSLGETGYFTEQTPYDPRSPYSASKASSDHLVRAYFHTYGLPVCITNCSNNYGPYQFPEKLIPLMINNALKGDPLPVYGDGKNVRDWLFVEDHCEAIVTVIEKGKVGEAYNIGGNNEKQNLEVVTTLCNILDDKVGALANNKARRELITFVGDRLGHDRRYAIDAGKIASELGWQPKYTFEQGIAKTVDWYLDNSDWMESIISGAYQQYYKEMYENR